MFVCSAGTMMVETMLDSSHDFGMSGGSLPQWKRELLQRRAARSRPPAPPPPAPPPPPAAPAPDDDEELRYGPGIVKRLKSRYLSLALRDAPRRRPSVLRRAASLEHLLDQRPPPAPRPAARAPRPASLAPAPAAAAPRRDLVKRARSVDALSRLEPRDEPPASPPPAPPAPPLPAPPAPALPAAPTARASSRPPRRPAPLLRDAERPPPDVVKSTLRKFEPAPVRRAAPAARVSAALRGLERGASVGSTTPEARSPSPARSPSLSESRTSEEFEGAATSTPRPVSRAALEGIARAGSSTRYAFESPRRASHLPPLAASNPVLLGRARRVGVIRPMPAPSLERAPSAPQPPLDELADKAEEPRALDTAACFAEEAPAAAEPEPPSPRCELPSALVEPIPRPPPAEAPPPLPRSPPPAPRARPTDPIAPPKTELKPEPSPKPKLVNGHGGPPAPRAEVKVKEVISKLEPAEAEAPWSVTLKKTPAAEPRAESAPAAAAGAGGARRAGGGGRGAPPATSVVFNFSHRKEVPDYIENDGLILRASRRERIKAGEPGVVILNPELVLGGCGGEEWDADEGGEEADGGGPPSPCAVRFVNDNVLINGRSSLLQPRKDPHRIARLKLQFDDSLTRTFEYPSETSLCEDEDPPAPLAPPAGALGSNTHISSAALGRYTPHKTCADAFQLGVTRHTPPAAAVPAPTTDTQANGTSECESNGTATDETEGGAGAAGGGGEEARGCGAGARAFSDPRRLATDLLF